MVILSGFKSSGLRNKLIHQSDFQLRYGSGMKCTVKTNFNSTCTT
jgi:hypothetical protein